MIKLKHLHSQHLRHQHCKSCKVQQTLADNHQRFVGLLPQRNAEQNTEVRLFDSLQLIVHQHLCLCRCFMTLAYFWVSQQKLCSLQSLFSSFNGRKETQQKNPWTEPCSDRRFKFCKAPEWCHHCWSMLHMLVLCPGIGSHGAVGPEDWPDQHHGVCSSGCLQELTCVHET